MSYCGALAWYQGCVGKKSALLITSTLFSSTTTVVSNLSIPSTAVGWPWLNRLDATLSPIANHLCCSHHQDRRSHPHWPQNSHPHHLSRKCCWKKWILEEVDDKFSVPSLVGNNSVYIVYMYLYIYMYMCISIGSSAFLLETSQLFETFPNPEEIRSPPIPTTPFGSWKCRFFR